MNRLTLRQKLWLPLVLSWLGGFDRQRHQADRRRQCRPVAAHRAAGQASLEETASSMES
ncbi:hypothetical protein G8D25_04680 (plasmid) [Ralstonia solanacearum]|nr:hypothetical protein G8D25_04680 [Ralstonia solanacearum]